MKKLIFLLGIIVLNVQVAFGLPGELWFYIDDDITTNYKIVATRYNLNEPLFGSNFMEVDTDIYDEVISNQINTIFNNPPYDFYLAFDFIRDPSGWPTIGEGKLLFSIYRNEMLVFRFKIDLLHSNFSTSGPDIQFYYSYGSDILMAIGGSNDPVEINFDGFINCWELHNEQRNIDYYENDVELTNGGDYGLNNNVKIIYQNSTFGFPYDNYPVGTEFTAGTHENFWRGARYNLTASHNSYNFNNILYKFRNWDLFDIYSTFGQIKIRHETSEISAMYNQTHPITVVNNLEGGNGGNYNVTWNQMPNNPEIVESNVAYNGFVYNPIRNDIYSLEVVDNFPALNTTWYFQKWDDGLTSTTKANIQVTAPQSYTAYYKGISRSNLENAYSNNSQRKFVRANNALVSAYESLGKVWIEFSRDGGQTWELGNAGKPLFNGNEAKNPALEFFNTSTSTSSILVVGQLNQDGNSVTAVSLIRLTPTIFLERTYKTVDCADGPFTLNTYPSIAMTGTNWFMLAWVIYEYGFSFLDFRVGEIVSETNLVFRGSQDFIYTDTHIKNISLFSTKPDQPQAQTELYPCWIAYEEDVTEQFSKIIAGRVDMDPNNYHLNTTGLNEVSRNSGFNKNIQPSILGLLDETARLCWIGVRGPDEIPNYTEGTEKTVVFTDPGTPNRFWTFGSNVNSASINKMNARYTIAWASDDITPIKFTHSGSLRTPYYSLNIKGKDVQLANGTTENTMYALAFNTGSQPYFMQNERLNFDAAQHEIQADEMREGIAGEEEAQAYFSLGDVVVNNEQISFVDIPDTISITSQQTANQYLVSEPFSLNENSEFFYSVKYGLTDSLAALSMLSGNKNLTFKVELLDAVTNEVLGVFDEVTYDQGNLVPYEKIDYQVLTNGIGERMVKLRLVIGSNFTPDYSVAEKYDEPTAMAKKNYKQINFNGSLEIKEYALYQNYPNPFNPTTTINYQIKEDGLVTLKIYDVLGSEVKTLVNEDKTKGRYAFNFNASDLASGVYIYQLRVNDFVSSKKLMLLK